MAGDVRIDDILDLGRERAPRYVHLPPATMPDYVTRWGRVRAVHDNGVEAVRDDGATEFVLHHEVVLHAPWTRSTFTSDGDH